MKPTPLFWAALVAAVLTLTSGVMAQNATGAGTPAKWKAKPALRIHPKQVPGISGYSPQQIRHAYGFDQVKGQGESQTIAIVVPPANPRIKSDLEAFCSAFNLPPADLEIVYPGGPPLWEDPSFNGLEASLDVEWAHAIAPKAKILLVVSATDYLDLPDPTNPNLNLGIIAAVDYAAHHASQVSMSWGIVDQDPTSGMYVEFDGTQLDSSGKKTYDEHFRISGVTFTAASGDSSSFAVWPASSPYVVGVGGTRLILDNRGNRVSDETAWGYSGGGISSYEPFPRFQSGWLNPTSTGGGRGIPDVSYVADPETGVAVFCMVAAMYDGSFDPWYRVGGTSVGAPQWAALFAISRFHSDKSKDAHTALYALAAKGNSSDVNERFFFDISFIGSGGILYDPLGTGYDLYTGLGSPHGNALIPALSSK